MLEIIKQNSEVIAMVFTAVVAVFTVVYALLTGFLVYETRKMRQIQTDPRIHITIERDASWAELIRLKIQNIGLGTASDLRFVPSVISGGEPAKKLLDEFTNPSFFGIGLRYFGPGQTIYSARTNTKENFKDKFASVLLFDIKYKSVTGKKYHQAFPIDMNEMKGRYLLDIPPMESIAQSIAYIQQDLAAK